MIVISANVVVEDSSSQAQRVADALSRAAVQLLLDGINASVSYAVVDDEDDGDGDDDSQAPDGQPRMWFERERETSTRLLLNGSQTLTGLPAFPRHCESHPTDK